MRVTLLDELKYNTLSSSPLVSVQLQELDMQHFSRFFYIAFIKEKNRGQKIKWTEGRIKMQGTTAVPKTTGNTPRQLKEMNLENVD